MMLDGDTFGQTKTHIYNIRDRIGAGASCYVYKGVEKRSGQTRALKVFKSSEWDRSTEKQREVLALSKLRHRNIIGYFGKEHEIGTGRGVLLMEFCSGGSLQTFLQEPENIHGLRDPEFLTFLSDTCAGCKYLLVHGFVHRDIKPGNILRHVQLDGSVVYKLADFGASKNVEDQGGEFMSLAGTEEYLHPEMYQQAFIRPGGRSVFTVGTDMWSLGVTIYHACAGEIPFKPYGGTRSNRSSMYRMITQKPARAIAGEQMSERPDSIHWRYSLPGTTPLSPRIQHEAVHIIGGLVESDTANQWTFSTLENAVHSLVSLRRVGVVSCDDFRLHTVYIAQNASLRDLNEVVAMATDIPASSQTLVRENRLLEDSDVNKVGSSVFDSEEEKDFIILINKDECENLMTSWHEGEPPSFRDESSVRHDLSVAVRLGSFLYRQLQQLQESDTVQRAQGHALFYLRSQVGSALHQTERRFKLLSETCEEKQRRMETLRDMETTRCLITRVSNQHVVSSTSTARRLLNKLHMEMWRTKDDLLSIREQVPALDSPDTDHSSGHQHSERMLQGSLDESKRIIGRMRERQDRTPLSDCETVLHEKDRKDLRELCQSCVFQWRNHLHKIIQPQHQRFVHIKGTCLKLLERLGHVDHVLDGVMKGRKELTHALTEASAFSGRAWKDVVSSLTALFNTHTLSRASGGESLEELKKNLEDNRTRFSNIMTELPEPERFDLDL